MSSIRRAVIGIRPEATPGTFLNPNTGEGTGAPQLFYAEDASWEPDQTVNPRNEARIVDSKLPDVVGRREAKLSFKVPIVGRGAGVVPHFHQALQACGMGFTTVASTSVTYERVSTFDGASGRPVKGYSACLWEDGKRYTVRGAVGDVEFSAAGGESGFLSFTLAGAYSVPVDEALPTPGFYSGNAPPVFQGVGLTIHSYSAIFEKLGIKLGNTLSKRTNANDSDGVLGYALGGRDTLGNIDPEEVLAATKDFWAIAQAGTVGALSMTGMGSVGNKFRVSCPEVQLRMPKMSSREDIRTLDIELAIRKATNVNNDGGDLLFIFE